jgi:branched-chain amino acid transport system substrate-binding protein
VVEEVVVGAVGAMAFDTGRDFARGAEMACDEINEAGGVLIRGTRVPVRVVKVDNNEYVNIADSPLAIEKAITVDKADFFVGGHRVDAALAMQDVCADYKKILATGACGASLYDRVVEDYERYKYYFEAGPYRTDEALPSMLQLHVSLVAAKMKEELGIEKPRVALLMDKRAYTEPMMERARKELTELGMEIVYETRPSSTATDLTSELLAIRDAEAHIIYSAASGASCIPLAKQWAELEIPACIIGNNCCAMVKSFWDAVEGKANYFCVWGEGTEFPLAVTPKTVPFSDKYFERFGERPGLMAAADYDGVHLYSKAIENAGTTDTDAVVAQLEKMEYVGVAGKYKWDSRHVLIWGPGYITLAGVQWVNGDWQAFWPMEYEGCPEEWNFHYEGTVPYEIPPWVKEYWQGKS